MTVLNSEAVAQYELLTKGQPTTFDSAVAVRLDRYRQETEKLKLGEVLVDSLKGEVLGLLSEQGLQTTLVKTQTYTISNLVQANERKDSVNRVLKTYFRKLDEQTQQQNKDNKLLKGGLAALFLVELVRLFTR